MLPSEKLRLLISKHYKINLEKFSWPDNFKNAIFSIELDSTLESNATHLKEIYERGFNIGRCGLTSRYLCINFGNAILQYGTCNILKGTKSSPNGEHAWTIINNLLIDTTLMICIPLDKIQEFGYIPTATIAKESSCMLSEYDVFDNEYDESKKNPDYQEDLFQLKL